jgi:hypothetical protein
MAASTRSLFCATRPVRAGRFDELEVQRGASSLNRRSPAPSADQLQRVLLNLVTNALRHTPSHRSIAVLVEPHSARAPGDCRGHRRRPPARAAEAHVRAFLAGRRRAHSRQVWGRPRTGNRTRSGRGPRRPDLVGAPFGWGRASLLHACAPQRIDVELQKRLLRAPKRVRSRCENQRRAIVGRGFPRPTKAASYGAAFLAAVIALINAGAIGEPQPVVRSQPGRVG